MSQILEDTHFSVPSFHAYGHVAACQVKNIFMSGRECSINNAMCHACTDCDEPIAFVVIPEAI